MALRGPRAGRRVEGPCRRLRPKMAPEIAYERTGTGRPSSSSTAVETNHTAWRRVSRPWPNGSPCTPLTGVGAGRATRTGMTTRWSASSRTSGGGRHGRGARPSGRALRRRALRTARGAADAPVCRLVLYAAPRPARGHSSWMSSTGSKHLSPPATPRGQRWLFATRLSVCRDWSASSWSASSSGRRRITRSSWPGSGDAPAGLRAFARFRFEADRLRTLETPTLLLVGSDTRASLKRPPRKWTPPFQIYGSAVAGSGHGAHTNAPQLLATEILRFLTAPAHVQGRTSSSSAAC